MYMSSDGGSSLAALNIGGEECQTFDDVEHAKLRAVVGAADDFLADFDWSALKPGGGKGGNLMGFTKDRKYLVKEVNGTDHKQMRSLIKAFCEHVLAPEGTLMCLMLAHVKRPGKGNYLVMTNCLPKLELDPVAHTMDLFDLKGCDDDKIMIQKGVDVPAVHKRFSKPVMWLGKLAWNDARHTYYNGKKHAKRCEFIVSPAAHAWLTQRIDRDCDFLKANNLMDYSLVLSERIVEASEVTNHASAYHGAGNGQPFMAKDADGHVRVIFCGIIDFLQPWVFTKKIAKRIKSFEFNKATEPPPLYARRFAKHFREKFKPTGIPIREDPIVAAMRNKM